MPMKMKARRGPSMPGVLLRYAAAALVFLLVFQGLLGMYERYQISLALRDVTLRVRFSMGDEEIRRMVKTAFATRRVEGCSEREVVVRRHGNTIRLIFPQTIELGIKSVGVTYPLSIPLEEESDALPPD